MTVSKCTSLLLLLTSCLVLLTGCGDKPQDDLVLWSPEYDCVDGCDVFSASGTTHDFTYAAQAFDGDAGTQFSPYVNETWLNSPAFSTNAPREVYAFVKANAICLTDDSGDCIDFNGVLNEMEHRSYVAGVDHYYPNSGRLGITLNGGSRNAIALVFYQEMQACAQRYNLGFTNVRKYTVIHELGHLRAGLSELCSGGYVSGDHDQPTASFTCVMANCIPRPACLEATDADPLTWTDFCSSCQANIKSQTW